MKNRTTINGSIELDITIFCAECGNGLEITETDEQQSGTDIRVEPCEICADEITGEA